jgi:hypothetical protein
MARCAIVLSSSKRRHISDPLGGREGGREGGRMLTDLGLIFDEVIRHRFVNADFFPRQRHAPRLPFFHDFLGSHPYKEHAHKHTVFLGDSVQVEKVGKRLCWLLVSVIGVFGTNTQKSHDEEGMESIETYRERKSSEQLLLISEHTEEQ